MIRSLAVVRPVASRVPRFRGCNWAAAAAAPGPRARAGVPRPSWTYTTRRDVTQRPAGSRGMFYGAVPQGTHPMPIRHSGVHVEQVLQLGHDGGEEVVAVGVELP